MTTRLRALAWVTLALLAAVVAAGCAGSEGDPEVVPTTTEGYPIVNQNRLRFIPKNLTVPAGQTVLFRNSETAIHDVLIDGVNISGNMRKGDEVIYTFDHPGTYTITCSFHPQMRARIEVVPRESHPQASSN